MISINDAVIEFKLTLPFTEDELKIAYRKLALLWHPDREGGSKERMSYVNECFGVLRDSIHSTSNYTVLWEEFKSSINYESADSITVCFNNVMYGKNTSTIQDVTMDWAKLFEQLGLWE